MAYRTREQIEKAFTVVDGIIRTPGRYEGESIVAPYYDTLANEGDGDSRTPQCMHDENEDCDCQAWDMFRVDADERDMFSPYLDGVTDVWLWIDSQGFLVVKTNTTEQELRRHYHGIED